jgi:hypothetical protein
MSHVYALRASARAFDYVLDIRGITDPTVEIGIPGGAALIAFVDAVMGVSQEDPDAARDRVIDELDGESLFDAATVYGNFSMMNRVAEATGIPISRQVIDRERATIDVLGLERLIKA